MRFAPKKLIGGYTQLRPQDATPAEYSAQMTKCQGCAERIRGRCRLANGRPVALLARRKETCPLEKGQRNKAAKGQRVFPSAPSASAPLPLLLETERIAHEVTIGVSAFRRPDCVRRLYDSIRRYYPTVRIVIADCGDQPAELPDDPRLRMIDLRFDAGLSASRNAIVEALETPYLFLLDDDFVLTSDSDAGRLLDVLDADPGLGVAGGAIWDYPFDGPSRLLSWALDFTLRNGAAITTPAARPSRQTAAGNVYYESDTAMNFALFRREFLADHKWREELKILEHAPFYLDVLRAGKWRVACVESVRCEHRRERPDEYVPYRSRLKEYRRKSLLATGLKEIQLVKFDQTKTRSESKPNVIVIGIGHSGTTPTTRLLHSLGWHRGDADEEYAESVEVREINQECQRTGRFDSARARQALARLGRPWAIKDPRFTVTLDRWREVLRPYAPALLWVTRDEQAVMGSYARRGERLREADSYKEAYRRAREQFDAWPGPKLRLDFEQVLAAAQVIDPHRPPGGQV